MESLPSMLHLIAPALLCLGALAAVICMCAVLVSPPREAGFPVPSPKDDPMASVWTAVLQDLIGESGPHLRLERHTPLGRIISSASDDPVDYLIWDGEEPVVAATQLPYLNSPEAERARSIRDRLEQHGIPVVEVLPDDSISDITEHMRALLLSANRNALAA